MPHSKRTRIEDADEDDVDQPPCIFKEYFPTPAGSILEEIRGERELPRFEALWQSQRTEGKHPWEPFDNLDEWDLVRWLIKAGVSQGEIDNFLKLNKVHCR